MVGRQHDDRVRPVSAEEIAARLERLDEAPGGRTRRLHAGQRPEGAALRCCRAARAHHVCAERRVRHRREDAHVADARVRERGEGEVDEAVLAGERRERRVAG